jgi:hypothetical protein
MHILVSNLPADVSEERLQEVFAKAGLNATIKLNREGDASKVTAVVESPDMDRPAADRLAARINGMQYEGHKLSAYVPLFM